MSRTTGEASFCSAGISAEFPPDRYGVYGRAPFKLHNLPLARSKNIHRCRLAEGCDQALDGIIIAAWIMMRERNSFHQRLLGDLHHVFDGPCPQPIFVGYSCAVYCASWMRRSAPRMNSAWCKSSPEILPSPRPSMRE